LEVEIVIKESDKQQQVVSQSIEESINKLVIDVRVNEQDSRRTIDLGESHSNLDDGCEGCKSETYYAYVHMDEKDE